MEKGIEQLEANANQKLYNCAKKVEEDNALDKEMQPWNITTSDGLNDNETW